MGEDEGYNDLEPKEGKCELCEGFDNIDYMVDCPKFSEDLGEDGFLFLLTTTFVKSKC